MSKLPANQLQTINPDAGLMSAQTSPRNAKQEEKQPTAELAKIQATSAAHFNLELLAVKCPAQPQTEMVVEFVDFSSKYGLGYKLSNGSYGVLFNDSTKIVTHPNLFHFDYIDRNRSCQAQENQEKVYKYDFYDYPETINKKVVLLQHFKSYLDGNQKFKPLEFAFTKENAPARQDQDNQVPYIKKWKRARKAILLRNSNKMIQVLF